MIPILNGVCICNVLEIRVAYGSTTVPRIHRVDRLRKLRAARLVDAASVDPDPTVAVPLRDLAAPPYFGAREVARILARPGASPLKRPEVLICLLILVPDVREDRIAAPDILRGWEEVQFCPTGAQKTHGRIGYSSEVIGITNDQYRGME